MTVIVVIGEAFSSLFKVLDGVALVAKKYDKTLIEVAGHTDNVGSSDYNRRLYLSC